MKFLKNQHKKSELQSLKDELKRSIHCAQSEQVSEMQMLASSMFMNLSAF